MTELVIPIALVACAAVLLALLAHNERELRKPEPEPEPSAFEAHQRRVRAGRRHAERRQAEPRDP